jgi:hypothetical protein
MANKKLNSRGKGSNQNRIIESCCANGGGNCAEVHCCGCGCVRNGDVQEIESIIEILFEISPANFIREVGMILAVPTNDSYAHLVDK